MVHSCSSHITEMLPPLWSGSNWTLLILLMRRSSIVATSGSVALSTGPGRPETSESEDCCFHRSQHYPASTSEVIFQLAAGVHSCRSTCQTGSFSCNLTLVFCTSWWHDWRKTLFIQRCLIQKIKWFCWYCLYAWWLSLDTGFTIFIREARGRHLWWKNPWYSQFLNQHYQAMKNVWMIFHLMKKSWRHEGTSWSRLCNHVNVKYREHLH